MMQLETSKGYSFDSQLRWTVSSWEKL